MFLADGYGWHPAAVAISCRCDHGADAWVPTGGGAGSVSIIGTCGAAKKENRLVVGGMAYKCRSGIMIGGIGTGRHRVLVDLSMGDWHR